MVLSLEEIITCGRSVVPLVKVCFYCISDIVALAHPILIKDNRQKRTIPDESLTTGGNVLLMSLHLAHFYKLLMHKIKASFILLIPVHS